MSDQPSVALGLSIFQESLWIFIFHLLIWDYFNTSTNLIFLVINLICFIFNINVMVYMDEKGEDRYYVPHAFLVFPPIFNTIFLNALLTSRSLDYYNYKTKSILKIMFGILSLIIGLCFFGLVMSFFKNNGMSSSAGAGPAYGIAFFVLALMGGIFLIKLGVDELKNQNKS